jgi:hypothetical protein
MQSCDVKRSAFEETLPNINAKCCGQSNSTLLNYRNIKFKNTFMTDNQKDFLLKEYDKLNNEVAKLLEETRTREKYSLTIISAVAAWIFTEIIKYPHDSNITQNFFFPIKHLMSLIPLVITFI